ncbi:MAG: hypothetical protein PHE83_02215 [Opitutaceae bacterium]|nr:hypothetical protein [Opitutaceae bacterium]
MPTAPAKPRSTATISDGGTFALGCADFFDEAGRLFGLPPSVCRIYGLLYGSPKPLSFMDIIEQLEISKGSASQGLQLLCSLGAINVAESFKSTNRPLSVTPDGGRREYYEPELSLRKLVSGVLRKRVAPMAATSADRLARLRELAEQEGKGTHFYLERVKQLNTWRRQLNAVLPVLSVLLGPKNRK